MCASVWTGHEDFKATDSRDSDSLIVRCSEGFDGGLPLTNYELEVYSEENVYHTNTIYLNHTDRSGSSGPVFEVSGLEPGRNYRLHLYAVNAKGRSDPVVLEPVTLKGVAMYTTGESLPFFCKASLEILTILLFRSTMISYLRSRLSNTLVEERYMFQQLELIKRIYRVMIRVNFHRQNSQSRWSYARDYKTFSREFIFGNTFAVSFPCVCNFQLLLSILMYVDCIMSIVFACRDLPCYYS